jgi:AcrR family transcriptional regulator
MSPLSRRTGRPRSVEADRAILGATRAALVELGWGKLTMGDVAARAGVAKTTLYRRWAGKNELVVDAVAAIFDEHLTAADCGSLRADIEYVVVRFAELLELPETKTALMAVVAEATQDEALGARVRSAIVDRQKRLVLIGRERAQLRGELPREEDPVPYLLALDLVADPQDLQIAGDRAVVALTPTTFLSPFSSARWYWKAASAISPVNQPSSMPRRMPEVIGPIGCCPSGTARRPRSLICSKISSASASIRSVSASTYQEPPSGSATLRTPVSSISTCWVRRAISAACSLGSARVSSRALVCSELVPPSTAAAPRRRSVRRCCTAAGR